MASRSPPADEKTEGAASHASAAGARRGGCAAVSAQAAAGAGEHGKPMAGFVFLADRSGVRELKHGDLGEPEDGGFLWEHIELADAEGGTLLQGCRDIPDIVKSALVASESRPRCEQIGAGAFINLRGPAEEPNGGDDRLVSIRAWADGGRVLSVSRRRLAATPSVVEEMRGGEITDAGDLVSAFCQKISGELDPVIASLGDMVDDCETEITADKIYHLRRRITASRSDAIAFRRFIAPNRDALVTLAALPMEWLSEQDRLHIHEAADRFARMAEELEAIRERSALLHEQLTDLRAEIVEQRSLLIAVVAFIFLPLTFITGLLGMNVAGIPFARAPWAFWGVVAFCILVGLAVLAWFRARHWLGK